MNENSNKQGNKNFFQLTKQQLSVDVEKYNNAYTVPSVFNTVKNIESSKVHQRSLLFSKRLNTMDSTMLEEKVFDVIDNEELRIEKKIELYEERLAKVNEQIEVAEAVQDNIALEDLSSQKALIAKTLCNLQEEYKTQNLDTKITNVFVQAKKMPKDFTKLLKVKIKTFVKNSKFLRKYTPIVRSIMMRDTLNKLNKINQSVDQLVKMKVPFGEQEERYQTLINHLSKANALHTQIEREIRG